jgi:hypothetical protein
MNEHDTRGELLIQREERKHERSKAKAVALEETMKKTIAAQLKNVDVKRSLAPDVMAATSNPSRRDELLDKAIDGKYQDDGEVFTGWEDKPWER